MSVNLLLYGHKFHGNLCIVESVELRPIFVRQQADLADFCSFHQLLSCSKQILGEPQHPFFRELLIPVFQRHVVQAVCCEELDGHASGHHARMILFHEGFVTHQQVVVRVPAHPVSKQVALVNEFNVLVHRAGLQHLVKRVDVVGHGAK